MRNLIFAINLTADGCCDHTKFSPGDEVHDYFTQLTQSADLLLYGRKTYELMVPFWPEIAKNNSGPTKAINDFAHALVATKKIVFSRTLDKVADENTTLIHTGLQDEILKLKQTQGGNMLIGGVDLASQLIKLNLVDEFRFVIHPVIAGEGRRLLDDIDMQDGLPLVLTDTKLFKSGSVALRYLKAEV